MEIPWVIKEQTKLKLKLLQSYIAPWARILFKQAKKIGVRQHLLYIDGFSGPGEYYETEEKKSCVDGSPIIVADIANELIEQDTEREFDLICIDKETKCLDILEPKLKKLNKFKQNWVVMNANFEDEIDNVLHNSKLPPTFCFIDPF
ncbi:MAG: three-Cys-motif partner protein TcmP, partial [Candidatus Cloacimonadota bacterium]|nr:three-Cys-motif partner protein TcmP [Candidatus Cloacimonadota bacterium]